MSFYLYDYNANSLYVAQTNFPEYMEVVGQSLVHFGGQACYDAFESAADTVQSMVDSGKGSSDWAQLEKDFVTCAPVEDVRDMNVMLSDLMGNVQGR